MSQQLRRLPIFASAAALAFALAACGTEQGEDEYAPEFEADQGQLPVPETRADYPDVVGWQVGRAFPNLSFIGYANFKEGAPGQYQLIHMSDFYNPTGDEMWPEGSPYGTGPKPKAIVMDISAVWCDPCKYESSVIIPQQYDKFGPMGGYFMTALIEGNDTQNPRPTTFDELTSWAQSYKFDVPLVLDPEWNTRVFLDEGWPTNLIIRTSDMKVIDRLGGVPEPGDPFWSTFESVINGTYQG